VISRHDATTHNPRRRLMASSPVMPSMITLTIRAPIYQWSYELFVLQSINGLATQHNVLNSYVAMVTSEESLFC
jgi:hypothetical protein